MCWGNIRAGMYREGCRTAGVRVTRQGSRETAVKMTRKYDNGSVDGSRGFAPGRTSRPSKLTLMIFIAKFSLVNLSRTRATTAKPPVEGVKSPLLRDASGAVVPEIPGGRLAENASLQALAFAGGGVDASLRGRAASHVSKRRKTLTGRRSKMGPTVPTRRRAEDSAFLSAPRDSIAYLVCKESMPVS